MLLHSRSRIGGSTASPITSSWLRPFRKSRVVVKCLSAAIVYDTLRRLHT